VSAPKLQDNGVDNTCAFKLSPPDTGILTGASIKGTVEVFCKIPPQAHKLDLHLQRLVNGGWTDQSSRTWTDIPPTIPMYRLTTASCVPGLWRVVVSVRGVSPTGKPFDHEGFTGMTKKVEPHDCG
jgi:hypothetical protein